jgi:hypothetical protein
MTKGSVAFSMRAAVGKTFFPATTFHESVAVPFVIPSEAEGSAVLRTSLEMCFDTNGLERSAVLGIF